MSAPHLLHLTDRALIRVAGEEATHFLQNLITNDLDSVDAAGAGFGALLTPQGKIQFDFLIYKSGSGYLLDTPQATAADLLKRLTFYRLRAKVELEAIGSETGVFAGLDEEMSPPENADLVVRDPRLPALGWRVAGPVDALTANSASTDGLAHYHARRIALGVPEGGYDFDYSDIFPHDADMDQLGGVSFTKGCYVGQEVVSRVQHRGTARKRFLLVDSAAPLPEKGTPVMADGKSVGEIGSSTSVGGAHKGLAVVRLDKVHRAIENGAPLTCGDAAVAVTLPAWATFGWPEATAAD